MHRATTPQLRKGTLDVPHAHGKNVHGAADTQNPRPIPADIQDQKRQLPRPNGECDRGVERDEAEVAQVELMVGDMGDGGGGLRWEYGGCDDEKFVGGDVVVESEMGG